MYKLSCLIPHIRCTKKVWKPPMILCTSIRHDKVLEITIIGLLVHVYP